MKLTFRIKYCTVWGESLRVIINNDEKNSLALFTRDGQEWQGTFDYDLPENEDMASYRYAVFRNERCKMRKERVRSNSSLYYKRQCTATSFYFR